MTSARNATWVVATWMVLAGMPFPEVEAAVGEKLIHSESFDATTLEGWTMDGLWHHTSTCEAHTWPRYLGFHWPRVCGLSTAEFSHGNASFALDTRPGHLRLEFYEHVYVSATYCLPGPCNGYGYLSTAMFARVDGGAWTAVERTGDGCGWKNVWHRCSVNLTAFSGGRTEVRFYAKGITEAVNDGSGWWIDTLSVYAEAGPEADAGPDQDVVDADGSGGETVRLDGSASVPPSGGTLTYEWSEGTLVLGTSAVLEVGLAVGTHDIRLKVTDEQGRVGVDDVRVVVRANQPPVARAGPDALVEDVDGDGAHAFTLDGSASHDDAGIVSALWTGPDGWTSDELVATRTLPLGTHTFTVSVTDASGAATSDDVTLTLLANQPPLADAGPDLTATDGDASGSQPIPLDGSASTDGRGTIVAYEWYEDAQLLATGARPTVDLPVGRHALRLVVTDQAGATASDDLAVDVLPNAPPTPVFGVSCYGRDCTFDARASSDADGEVVLARWDFGDGGTAEGLRVRHKFDAYTPRTVTVEVVDSGGATVSDERSFELTREPPRAAPLAPPRLLHVVDDRLSTSDLLAEGADVRAAWFEASPEELYVGLHVDPLAGGSTTSWSIVPRVQFTPAWSVADPSWSGLARSGQPTLSTVMRIAPLTRETSFVLEVDGHELAQLNGSYSPQSGIVWWVVPRALLQDPARDAVVHAPSASVSIGSPAGDFVADTTYVGAAFRFHDGNRSFDATHDFALGDEGFLRVNDQRYSSVAYDSTNKRLAVVSDRDDRGDELMVRHLPQPLTPESGSFLLSARWAATTQGNWQAAFPLFLTGPDATDVAGSPSSLHVRYVSRDYNLRQQAGYELRFLDSAGVPRISTNLYAPANGVYEFQLSYDLPSRTLRATLADAAGTTLRSSSYVVGTNANDGFSFGRFGVAADGYDSTDEPVVRGWVDDVRLRFVAAEDLAP